MVKAYQFLNEYKQWNPRTLLPESSGVAFSQQGNNNKSAQCSTEWKKKKLATIVKKRTHQAQMSRADDRKR